jgi:hypothetical protein
MPPSAGSPAAGAEGTLTRWLGSCTRRGTLSRNTVAVGIVVLHSLRSKCPLAKIDVVTKGGEIKGSRKGLGAILGEYGVVGYLKEATTRQAHQDGQRLLKELRFGKDLARLRDDERDRILRELIDRLVREATTWLSRQHLRITCKRGSAPGSWVAEIIERAQGRSGGRVEQHLVGAKLAEAHRDVDVPILPGTAGDAQTGRAGDFQIRTTVCHVTAAPGEAVVKKCEANADAGLHPVLLVPSSVKDRALLWAENLGMRGRLTVIAIEDFLSVNIIEHSGGETQNFIETLRRIVTEYNRRVAVAETDTSLTIEIE